MLKLEIGQPYILRSLRYGDTAVHLKGYSPNGKVAILSIDGGAASRQAQNFPELADGITHASIERLIKRPRRPSRRKETPTEIVNNIREVSGVGKVAVITEKEVTF